MARKVEKFLEGCHRATDLDGSGKYLLGVQEGGDAIGVYAVSIADRKCFELIPGVETQMVRRSQDGKSILYAVQVADRVTIYRQGWQDGKLLGEPEVAVRLPFAFPLTYLDTAYDFPRDLSAIVYAAPSGQADLYLLSAPR